MKPTLILILTVLQLMPALAGDKATVDFNENGHSVSGGGPRAEEIDLQFGSGMREAEVPVADKIRILERKLSYHRLMTGKKVDLEKSITATYKNKPLGEVFKELIPGIPVEFKGVDQKVTVGSIKITKVSLDKVFQSLAEAAGVYFSFSEKGLLVTATPQ